jgi:hypothetical protein
MLEGGKCRALVSFPQHQGTEDWASGREFQMETEPRYRKERFATLDNSLGPRPYFTNHKNEDEARRPWLTLKYSGR